MKRKYIDYRVEDIRRKTQCMEIRPYDVMITGVTGAGKSTTMNSFFQEPVAGIGDGPDPQTMEISPYSLNQVCRFWDTPGLGDGKREDQEHIHEIIEKLNQTYNYKGIDYGFIDMVLVILDGSVRDMGTTYFLLNDVILPNIQSNRVFVAINQADMAMKGRGWEKIANIPNLELLDFLEQKAISVQKRIKEATNLTIRKPVYYSAQYDYNIEKLYDMLIDNMPIVRRPCP